MMFLGGIVYMAIPKTTNEFGFEQKEYPILTGGAIMLAGSILGQLVGGRKVTRVVPSPENIRANELIRRTFVGDSMRVEKANQAIREQTVLSIRAIGEAVMLGGSGPQ
jgi:hypothetical protein